ncbi:MAG TPA: class I SAM-dependent methyltransferase [Verrucomicrobiae bacterium]|nr:class I SAM-dependent methyltransferase [Verrucomicrobiae bacterium]
MAHCSHPSTQLETLFPARDYITGDRFEIVICPACGNTLTWPQPLDLSPYYPASYYGSASNSRFPAPVEILQRTLYRHRAGLVEQHCSEGKRKVLDVGCGRGLLLDAFRRRGWETEGTEFSDAAASYARAVLGLNVHIGELSALQLSEKFDAVTLWHVLEHVRDPSAILSEVNGLLKPGGVVLIGIPNFGGWEARLCRDKWFHLDVPRHLVHFPRGRLRQLLDENGFEVIVSSGFAFEYDLFSFVQSLLNRTGLRHNLLYNFLRQGPAKILGQGTGSGFQVFASLVLGSVFGLAGLPTILLAGMLRQGGTLTLLARKRTAGFE